MSARAGLEVTARDHVRGSPTAPITLLEYGDFQCPYCREAAPVAERVLAIGDGRVRLVFRHFPLTQIHPHALLAAEAAEAAGAQGRFWEAHDLFFNEPVWLALEDPDAFARTLGIDPRPFSQDLEESRYLPHVRASFMTGVRSGVNGTPSFFVNGQLWQGGSTLEELLTATGLDEGQPFAG